MHGYKTFDPDVHVSSVLFNRVAGVAHSEWIMQAMRSHPTTRDVAVLGCLPKDKMLDVPERLLGLLPPAAAGAAATRAGSGKTSARLSALLRLVKEHVDLEALRRLAALSNPPRAPLPSPSLATKPPVTTLPPVRIAVARDAALLLSLPR